jgi:hypothetical protein
MLRVVEAGWGGGGPAGKVVGQGPGPIVIRGFGGRAPIGQRLTRDAS